jgi:hypothetical protein
MGGAGNGIGGEHLGSGVDGPGDVVRCHETGLDPDSVGGELPREVSQVLLGGFGGSAEGIATGVLLVAGLVDIADEDEGTLWPGQTASIGQDGFGQSCPIEGNEYASHEVLLAHRTCERIDNL